jgi:hypothetical protein
MHRSGEERRCDQCEIEYLARETAKVQKIVVAMVIVCAALGFVSAFVMHLVRNGFLVFEHMHLTPLAPSAVMGVLCLAFALPPLIRHRFRGRFLSERVRPPSPTA